LKSLLSLLSRHAQAFWYIITVVLPVIIRTRTRPVIFSRFTGMGDIICTIPAALELKKRHPGGVFIYNCDHNFAVVPRLAGVAERVTSLKNIGPVGHWYGFLLGGFYHFAHGDDTTGKVAQEPMVAEFCRQFDLPATDEHPRFIVTTAAQDKVKELLAEKKLETAKLVLIHPGPSWPAREWPRENWAQLVAALRARGFTSIAQLGAGSHLIFGRVEATAIPEAVSLLDALTIEECIAVIGQAKLFIGIDSGLLHIAACTRTPAVGLFGMTLPEFRFSQNYRKDFVTNRVECAGCEHRKPRLHWFTGCPYDIKCMKTIRVEEVLQACLSTLGRGEINH
jgi:ADP-heptose:LPS heptosyltransferase